MTDMTDTNGKNISSTAIGLSKQGTAGVIIAALIVVGFVIWIFRPKVDLELIETLKGVQATFTQHSSETKSDNASLILGIEKLRSAIEMNTKAIENQMKWQQQRASVNVDVIKP